MNHLKEVISQRTIKITVLFFHFFFLIGDKEIYFHENQSDDKKKTTLVTATQIFNCETDKKTLGFGYKLSQVSPWIEFYKDQNQSYTINGHQDRCSWREILILLLMHLGKFLNIVPLNEVLAQSVFGKTFGKFSHLIMVLMKHWPPITKKI